MFLGLFLDCLLVCIGVVERTINDGEIVVRVLSLFGILRRLFGPCWIMEMKTKVTRVLCCMKKFLSGTSLWSVSQCECSYCLLCFLPFLS